MFSWLMLLLHLLIACPAAHLHDWLCRCPAAALVLCGPIAQTLHLCRSAVH